MKCYITQKKAEKNYNKVMDWKLKKASKFIDKKKKAFLKSVYKKINKTSKELKAYISVPIKDVIDNYWIVQDFKDELISKGFILEEGEGGCLYMNPQQILKIYWVKTALTSLW